MAERAICSESCLKWSPQAYAEFEEYFSKQQARCNLLNYPRSLDVPKPKKVHSAAAQCECYGFQPAMKQDESIPEDECGLPIICKIRNSEDFVQATLPMDGTPCGLTKVCWEKKCVNYGRNF
uniref:ADAMTS cysteine-rich domain-containing protein n=1 Tax=Meteorus pulchricornis TaxID=51522 RepID=H7CHK5_9HYME|nr:hypothetical protein [Meteorus pulchricornis]